MLMSFYVFRTPWALLRNIYTDSYMYESAVHYTCEKDNYVIQLLMFRIQSEA